MRVSFGKDAISKHYELLHYIVLDNQILARYLAEKLSFDFTLPLEELYFQVMDKLDEIDPMETSNLLEEVADNSSQRMIEIKEYLARKRKGLSI